MLEIKLLKPEMEQALADFFVAISKDNYARYYCPYSLTSETAKELCGLSGKDLYYVLIDKEVILGHGMLRGWDEGYLVPSLGIVIHPDAINMGLGTMLTRFLHSVARFKGCPAVRLSVYKDCMSALSIYKKLGYTFAPQNDKKLIGTLLLSCHRRTE
jgi:ribosomal protein S18 acetylase RimI-like enzyme